MKRALELGEKQQQPAAKKARFGSARLPPQDTYYAVIAYGRDSPEVRHFHSPNRAWTWIAEELQDDIVEFLDSPDNLSDTSLADACRDEDGNYSLPLIVKNIDTLLELVYKQHFTDYAVHIEVRRVTFDDSASVSADVSESESDFKVALESDPISDSEAS